MVHGLRAITGGQRTGNDTVETGSNGWVTTIEPASYLTHGGGVPRLIGFPCCLHSLGIRTSFRQPSLLLLLHHLLLLFRSISLFLMPLFFPIPYIGDVRPFFSPIFGASELNSLIRHIRCRINVTLSYPEHSLSIF